MADLRKRDQSKMAAALGPLKVTLAKTSRLLAPVWKWMAKPAVLFTVILILGTAVRVWRFGSTPPGLNQDEASIGLEAYDLLHFGVDRNGISFPVNFVSWGNGMDALEGYLLIPFVAFGLNTVTIRLPVLLSGILSMLLVYLIGKRILGRTYALLAMFLLAVSPWHIMLSRWGINENILPFVFTLGFACLLLSNEKNLWFVAAMAFFGLSIYAYGAMYVAMPVFLLGAIPILLRCKRVGPKSLALGLLAFAVLAAPLVLFVLVNTFGWETVRLGPLTVPQLPGQARFLDVSAASSSSFLRTVLANGSSMLKLLLINQTDGYIWNSLGNYGPLYPFSIALAILGVVLLVPSRKADRGPERLLLLAWLLAALSIGLFQRASINRLHLVFIPLILCAAAFLDWLGSQRRAILFALLGVYLFGFYSFSHTYLGGTYDSLAGGDFHAGLLPALEGARQEGTGPICVTGETNMPYVYALLVEKPDPAGYLQEIRYANPEASFRQVISFGRYSFGLENCPADPRTIYVLTPQESVPDAGIQYTEIDFNHYRLFIPGE